MWLCQCDCGQQKTVRTEYLRMGDTKSCGCLIARSPKKRFTTHGQSKFGRGNGYGSWVQMKNRCLNPGCKYFHRYGGRGITICKAWLKFENFIADMGPRPSHKHSLDRIDFNGNYEPSNCRWATSKVQGRNTRRAIHLEFQGRTMSAMDALDIALSGITMDGLSVIDFLARHGARIGLARINRTAGKKFDGQVEWRT